MYNEINDEVRVTLARELLVHSHYFRIYALTNQFEFLAMLFEHYFETSLEFKKRVT
jgi:hypothetical protein